MIYTACDLQVEMKHFRAKFDIQDLSGYNFREGLRKFTFQDKNKRPFFLTLEIGMPLYQCFGR